MFRRNKSNKESLIKLWVFYEPTDNGEHVHLKRRNLKFM